MPQKKTTPRTPPDDNPDWRLEQAINVLVTSIDRLERVIESLDHAVLNLPNRLEVAIGDITQKTT